jgi:hypothetical protein
MSKFCRDCRSCVRSWLADDAATALEFSTCGAITRTDPVTGKDRHPLCQNEREYGTLCGHEGKMFVSKGPTVREQLERSLAMTPLTGSVN